MDPNFQSLAAQAAELGGQQPLPDWLVALIGIRDMRGPPGPPGPAGPGAMPDAAPGWTKIATQTAASSATIDFTGLSSANYQAYMIVFREFLPVTSGTFVMMRVTANNGSTWDTSAVGSYQGYRFAAGASSTGGNTGQTFMDPVVDLVWGQSAGGASEYGMTGYIMWTALGSSIEHPCYIASVRYSNSALVRYGSVSSGMWESKININGVRLLISSGNILTGIFTLYGLKA